MQLHGDALGTCIHKRARDRMRNTKDPTGYPRVNIVSTKIKYYIATVLVGTAIHRRRTEEQGVLANLHAPQHLEGDLGLRCAHVGEREDREDAGHVVVKGWMMYVSEGRYFDAGKFDCVVEEEVDRSKDSECQHKKNGPRDEPGFNQQSTLNTRTL